MKNAIKFLLFVTYSTSIFFLTNNKYIIIFAIFNLFIMHINKLQAKKVMTKSMQVLPFIAFTFIINYMLDNFYNALCIGLKLFKVNTDDIKVMICISLSVIPILKKDLYELKEACKAKKITLNLKNIKIVLVKFFLSLILRVNEIEESMIEKGYSNQSASIVYEEQY